MLIMSMTLLHAQDLPAGLQDHAVSVMRDESVRQDPMHRMPALNDELVAYLLDVRPAFDLLRDALSQAAAILLLIAAGSRDAVAHPMLAVIETHAGEAREMLHTLKVPRDAWHGHAHLLASSNALDDALRAIADENRMHHHIQRGLQELRFAASHLPGLDIVSGAESCACHASSRKAE
jgi:hypothetical protein